MEPGKIDQSSHPTPFVQTYFHGTNAELQVGDLITPGYNSNYGERKNARYIFLTATLDAAIWGAELAQGEGRERIYLVEPRCHRNELNPYSHKPTSFSIFVCMKTTLELPDDLLRAIKVRAAQEGRSMKDLLTDLLRSALSGKAHTGAIGKRKKLPVIASKRAKPGMEMTPERVAQVLYGSGQ